MTEDRDDQTSVSTDARPGVPPLLAAVAAWCWRLIIIGIVLFAVYKGIGRLLIVVLPCVIALLLCALLYPLTAWIRRRFGVPSLVATWLTMLLALAVLGGVGTYVGIRANSEWPNLATQMQKTARDIQHWLVTGPLHIKHSQLQSWANSLIHYLQTQRGRLMNEALQAGTVAVEIFAAAVFIFFVTFFLLKDGPQIWTWFTMGFGRHRDRVDQAGRAAWQTLSQYVHGSVLVAGIHAIVIAITLSIIGVPLVAPLAVVVFFGSFVPIVGILIAGGLAVLVTFSTRGWIAGLVFLGILIAEQQLEGHVLQPLVVGRWVRFHPLAIILAITIGGVLGGIPGAAVAVPTAAVIYRVWPVLRRSPETAAAKESGSRPSRDSGGETALAGAVPGTVTTAGAVRGDAVVEESVRPDVPGGDTVAEGTVSGDAVVEEPDMAREDAAQRERVRQDVARRPTRDKP